MDRRTVQEVDSGHVRHGPCLDGVRRPLRAVGPLLQGAWSNAHRRLEHVLDRVD
jgi:hypothetical protein